MNPADFDQLLSQMLGDGQLSRNEKQVLSQLLADEQTDEQQLTLYRSQAFAMARASVNDPQGHRMLDWLEEVVKLLHRRAPPAVNGNATEACFSPGDNCPARIAALIAGAQEKVDVCVFTITDDRISGPLVEAHRKGVVVRVITDNEKLDETGSDIHTLAAAGIAVKVDRTPYHMHHKFALFDDRLLLTGSYNWTRSAADKNLENFIVTSDPGLLPAFRRTFEKLWHELATFR